jgi:hypothetical protein
MHKQTTVGDLKWICICEQFSSSIVRMRNVILPFRPSTSGDFSWCAHNAVQAAADKRDVIVLQLG